MAGLDNFRQHKKPFSIPYWVPNGFLLYKLEN